MSTYCDLLRQVDFLISNMCNARNFTAIRLNPKIKQTDNPLYIWRIFDKTNHSYEWSECPLIVLLGSPPSLSSHAFCGELLHPFAKLFCAFSHRESRLLLLTHEGEQGNIKKERFEPGKLKGNWLYCSQLFVSSSLMAHWYTTVAKLIMKF